jgi:hypothetical protein
MYANEPEGQPATNTALLSALMTEHYPLQSLRGSTIVEANGRGHRGLRRPGTVLLPHKLDRPEPRQRPSRGHQRGNRRSGPPVTAEWRRGIGRPGGCEQRRGCRPAFARATPGSRSASPVGGASVPGAWSDQLVYCDRCRSIALLHRAVADADTIPAAIGATRWSRLAQR